jgi:hypothetical protein
MVIYRLSKAYTTNYNIVKRVKVVMLSVYFKNAYNGGWCAGGCVKLEVIGVLLFSLKLISSIVAKPIYEPTTADTKM